MPSATQRCVVGERRRRGRGETARPARLDRPATFQCWTPENAQLARQAGLMRSAGGSCSTRPRPLRRAGRPNGHTSMGRARVLATPGTELWKDSLVSPDKHDAASPIASPSPQCFVEKESHRGIPPGTDTILHRVLRVPRHRSGQGKAAISVGGRRVAVPNRSTGTNNPREDRVLLTHVWIVWAWAPMICSTATIPDRLLSSAISGTS